MVGDLLISKAYETVSDSKVSAADKVVWASEISAAVNSAVSGAVAELEFDANNKRLILENYYSMASRKTGALFALPARCRVRRHVARGAFVAVRVGVERGPARGCSVAPELSG